MFGNACPALKQEISTLRENGPWSFLFTAVLSESVFQFLVPLHRWGLRPSGLWLPVMSQKNGYIGHWYEPPPRKLAFPLRGVYPASGMLSTFNIYAVRTISA